MPELKPPISFDHNKCSGCVSLVCIGVCPQGILEVDVERKPRLVDSSSCTLCGVCITLCPQKAIAMTSSRISKEDRGEVS